MTTVISRERAAKFRTPVDEIFKAKDLSFPRQIIFKGQGQLFFFLTAAFKVMEPSFMCVLKASSTCSPVPARSWEKLLSLLLNLKFLQLF